MTRTALFALLLALALIVAPDARGQEPPRAPPPAALDEAKALFREGVALLEAGDVERALDRFLLSRARVPSGRNTVNAAICLNRLGRYDEALEMFEEVVTKHMSDLREADRATIAPAMAALRQKVGTIEISADVEGAAVHVDSRARGRLPLGAPLRVNPGRRRIRVIKDGYEPYEEQVDVPAGGARAVDAKIKILARRGQLRVEDPGNDGSEVFVDGLSVGTSPWEGTLAPRNYVIWTQRGDVGSPPKNVVVIEGQFAMVRARSGALGAATRIEADPRSAEITIDNIVVGTGTWQGRLAPGSHQARVAEAGYRTRTLPFDVAASGAAPREHVVKLAIDPAHPRWPQPPSVRFWLAAFGGYAVAPTLRSTAGAACQADCDGTVRADGGIAGLRAGVRFPIGISIELTGAYVALQSAFTRLDHRTFDSHPIVYELSDTLRMRGVLIGGGASYRRAIGPRLALVTRTTVGVLVASSDDRITANAHAGGVRDGVIVVGPSAAPRSTPLLVWPEAGLDVSLGPFHLGAMFGAVFAPLDGPAFERRELRTENPSQDLGHPGSVLNAPYAYLPQSKSDAERAYGPFVALTPHLSIEYTF